VAQRRFEYTTMLTLHTDWKKWHETLNKYGAEGWRVIEVAAPVKSGIPFNDGVIILLEREFDDETDSAASNEPL